MSSQTTVNTLQAARTLGVSQRRIQAMIASGRLPARRRGGLWTIKAADLADPAIRNRPPGRPRKDQVRS